MDEICHTSDVLPATTLSTLDVNSVRALTPAVALSLVVTCDGQIVGPDHSSRSISGPEDLEVLRTLRAAADVVIVTAPTAAHDAYPAIRVPAAASQSRTALGLSVQPQVVLLTRSGDLTGVRPELLDAPNTVVLRHAELETAINDVRRLYGPHVLVEAGRRFFAAATHIFDRLWLDLAPCAVGDQGVALDVPLHRFDLAQRYLGEQFVLHRFDRS